MNKSRTLPLTPSYWKGIIFGGQYRNKQGNRVTIYHSESRTWKITITIILGVVLLLVGLLPLSVAKGLDPAWLITVRIAALLVAVGICFLVNRLIVWRRS